MEASLRFGGPETMDTKIYGRLTAWQNWIFQRPNAVGEQGALTNYGKPTRLSSIDIEGGLEQQTLRRLTKASWECVRTHSKQRKPREDKKLQRALENWLPNYLDWWREMGPDGFQEQGCLSAHGDQCRA